MVKKICLITIFGILVFASSCHAAYFAENKVQVNCNNNAASTVVTNETGADAVLVGGNTTAELSDATTKVIDRALDLTPAADYIQLVDSVDFDNATDVSIFGWFYIDAMVDGGAFFGKWGGAGEQEWLLRMNEAVDPCALIFNLPTGALTTNDTILTAGAWHHIGFTFDNGTVLIYHNGSSVAWTGAAPDATLVQNTIDINIGSWNNGGGTEFNGKVDIVTMYFGKVLTPTEASDLFATGAGIETGLDTAGTTSQVIIIN